MNFVPRGDRAHIVRLFIINRQQDGVREVAGPRGQWEVQLELGRQAGKAVQRRGQRRIGVRGWKVQSACRRRRRRNWEIDSQFAFDKKDSERAACEPAAQRSDEPNAGGCGDCARAACYYAHCGHKLTEPAAAAVHWASEWVWQIPMTFVIRDLVFTGRPVGTHGSVGPVGRPGSHWPPSNTAL